MTMPVHLHPWPGLATVVAVGIVATVVLMALGILATLVATVLDLRALSRGRLQEPQVQTALLQSRWLPRGSRRVSAWQVQVSEPAFYQHHHIGGENATRIWQV